MRTFQYKEAKASESRLNVGTRVSENAMSCLPLLDSRDIIVDIIKAGKEFLYDTLEKNLYRRKQIHFNLGGNHFCHIIILSIIKIMQQPFLYSILNYALYLQNCCRLYCFNHARRICNTFPGNIVCRTMVR